MEIYDLATVKGKEWGVKGVLVLLFTLYALPLTLHATTPDGYIVRVDSATAYLDWGKTSGIKTGDTFDVYRAGAVLKHPVTGEVLGQTENTVGQGVIESLEDKYSIGHVLEHSGELKIGDRTRLKTAAPKVEAAPVVAAPVAATGPQIIWQSSPIAGTPRGIAVGDLEGPASHDVVVAFQDHLDVFHWQKDHLEKIASYKDRNTTNWMAVEVADPGASGHPKIFATWYSEGVNRARVAVIEWSSGTLKESGHFDGFARAFPREDGTRPLLVQDFYLSSELRLSEPKFVTYAKDKFKAGNSVPLSHPLGDRQLFGFAWGDWDGDKSEDFVFLVNGERPHIFFKDKKWAGDASYGGTKLSFSYNRSFDAVATLYPRLITVKAADGKELLLASYNESATILRFARIKSFRPGEIVALAWNGTDMTPLWRIPASAYIADYVADSVSDAQQAEVWVLTESSDDKSVVTGYKQP